MAKLMQPMVSTRTYSCHHAVYNIREYFRLRKFKKKFRPSKLYHFKLHPKLFL
jgi:hypothetical protein